MCKCLLLGKRKHSGFTLIELLVVIALIGIFASVVMMSLNQVRIDAREAARVVTIREVQKALEMYYTAYGQYPPQATPDNLSNLSAYLVPRFISAINYDMTNVSGPTYWRQGPKSYLIYVSKETQTQVSPSSYGCRTGVGPAVSSGLYSTSPLCPWQSAP